ncbi:outer membrane protein assembly factor BamB [Alkalilimnicola ehrlichii MLHE-1]|uniref:Outer membrane protein assembly factor BamB n=2 Tax=Alkalilimnicola ehrlichii TaxID=351052 RepID=BAMB_ALKEH|nr:RecName: Full=Outer membrane protein assembly factor BamB; Flags: Precursor [Alkalilimnicola ehrlichii MLHE-1]ABI56603.1 Pyrrolo-quinoline quinone [Alkalilimnicola ehrlichii MLHE-1]
MMLLKRCNRRALVALAAVLLLAACGGARELPDLSDVGDGVATETLWTASTGSGSASSAYALVPAVEGGRVYAADSNGRVTAWDAESGERLWRVDTGRELAAGPGAGGGLVLVGARDGRLLALDAENGEERWVSGLSSEILAVPQIARNIVVARSGDGRVYGLDGLTGRRLWIHDRSVPVLTLRGSSSPVVVGNRVVVGQDNGRLVTLNLQDGEVIWEAPVSIPRGRSDLERMVDLHADPLVFRGVAYAQAYQGELAAVGMGDGRERWSRDIPGHTGMAADSRQLYVVDDQSRLWALDRNNGATVWRQDRLQGLRLTAPVVIGGHLVLADEEGYLNWIAPDNGDLVGRDRHGRQPIQRPPVPDGDVLYLLSADGRLAALRLVED